jgi:uncharacterized protein YjbI with pentapeptide repeats
MLKNLYGEKRVAYTQETLAPVLADHARYASGNGGRRAVLRHADLSGLNLVKRNLAEADFSGSSLVGALLGGSNLERASLYCADLRDSNLIRAKLVRADMRGASFRGAKLANAVLDDADLRAAMMMVMGGMSALDRGGDKPSVGVDFSGASLKRVSFGNVKLDGANFEGALLQGASFRGAKLVNVSFKGAVLTGVHIEELGAAPAALEGCVLDVSPAALERVPLLRARIETHGEWILSDGKSGEPANLDGEDLRPLKALITGRPLAGLSAKNCVAVGVDFSGCQLQASHFDGADVRDANFTAADLRGASFRGSKLGHAKFAQANLCGLPLSGGASKAPDLSDCHATDEQFAQAIFDRPATALGLKSAA